MKQDVHSYLREVRRGDAGGKETSLMETPLMDVEVPALHHVLKRLKVAEDVAAAVSR